MIDPTDKQTQPLPFEQPKRGRGRPATGKALSDAERARRYRANKKKRDDQTSRKDVPSIPADGVKEILDGWQRTQDELDQALQRIAELEAELASRITENRDTVTDHEKWVVEFKLKNSRTWKPTGSEPMAKKDAIEVAQKRAERTKALSSFRARPLTEEPVVFGQSRK
ncbi:hypothetical protein [Pseudomonas aeruginosa]|uniref:hypothetical protein n=1 Tax=Pseudomonas aeruginosa TaxID=287 RepID=UPI0015D51BA3|nr:hypothetical protein [Pseudomonas aeruginosa]NYU30305.1 hypothetical protein [Pseudomonas aeruginosa]NYU30314.1 hypothetical protein [Pseudomonas aeruginosa]